MQVFNIFFKIAKKHLGQVFIFSGVFLVLIFIMSISQSKALSGDFSAKKIDITILDGDHSMLSQSIQDYLGSRHNLVTLAKTDTESLTDNLFYQQISYVLTIPKGFEAQFLTDTPLKLSHSIRQDNANGFFVNEQLDSYLDSISLYCTGGYSLTDAIAATGQNLEESPKVEAITFQKTGNSGNKTMFYWFQYMSYIFLMIFPLSLVPILVTFQQTDVSSRIACSALPAQARTLQLGLGCICYSILTWLIFTLVAVLFFGPKMFFPTGTVVYLKQLCIYIDLRRTHAAVKYLWSEGQCPRPDCQYHRDRHELPLRYFCTTVVFEHRRFSCCKVSPGLLVYQNHQYGNRPVRRKLLPCKLLEIHRYAMYFPCCDLLCIPCSKQATEENKSRLA